MARRCQLLDIRRTTVYSKPKPINPLAVEREEEIKRRIDYWHTTMPYMGTRKLVEKLRQESYNPIGRKLVRRYMADMGLRAVYPKPNLSKPGRQQKLPYLLKNKPIFLPNQVWALDITYIPLKRGHMYLTAVIDWYSRYIVGWTLSDTLETAPIIDAVNAAIQQYGSPAIINSDQGSQFTSAEYQQLLKQRGIRQSMDGKARWVDNVIIERWFRSLKVEYVYINEYDTPRELREGITQYVAEYNEQRPHQSLDYRTPAAVYANPFEEQATG